MFKYLESHNYGSSFKYRNIYNLAKSNDTFIQRMYLLKSLDVHRGCVNSVVWDDAGEFILSGSDDQHLVISAPWQKEKPCWKLRTAHRANIFSAKFMPFSSNQQIISCSGDGILIFTDLNRRDASTDNKFTCHVGTCYEVMTIPSDPHSFLSAGEDGTVRWFDLRVKASCLAHDCKDDILLNMKKAVTSIALNPLANFQLAVSTQDSNIHFYDRRMLGTKAQDSFVSDSNEALVMRMRPQCLDGKKHRLTCLRYSSDGSQILASYSSDYLYLFDTKEFREVPLQRTSESESGSLDDSEPTLKRLRLRGDWSDTGPQALPQGEVSTVADEVGQVRPPLQSTLMSRMTDILSRMLHSPNNRTSRRQDANGPQNSVSDNDPLQSVGDVTPAVETDPDRNRRGTLSAPPSIALPDEDEQPSTHNPPPPSETTDEQNNPLSICPTMRYDSILSSSTHPTTDQSTAGPSNSSVKRTKEHMDEEASVQTACKNNPSLSTTPNQSSDVRENEIEATGAQASKSQSLEGSSQEDSTRGESQHTNVECLETSQASSKTDTPCSSAEPQRTEPAEIESVTDSLTSSLREFRQRQNESQPSQDDDADGGMRAGRTSFGMCRLVNRVINRRRLENLSRSEDSSGSNRTEERSAVPYGRLLQQYKGHRNARTMIKEACFWGEKHVMSGSDCGRVFVWNKDTGRIVMLWEADRHVVNCLQPHPTLPVLATSGIDYDVKLWAPLSPEVEFDEDEASEICKRNEMLLAETRDTVTVPATFMIRMLATLNQLRRDRIRRNREHEEAEMDEEEEGVDRMMMEDDDEF